MKSWLQNKWALSITAGILLGLSFPPVNLSFLSFPAFILLFYLSEKCDSYKQLAYYSYAGFVVWNLIGTYWLMMASLGAGIAAILANSVLMTIPLCLGKFFSNKSKSPYLTALLQASAWVGYEYLHHHWDLSWTWLALGNGWSNWIGIIQYISITGFLGISFWVVLSSALAYQAIQHKDRALYYTTLVVFLAFPITSFFMFQRVPEPDTDEGFEVAVIQPNHDSYQPLGGMKNIHEVMDSLFSITEKTITEKTELVIWPENAIDDYITLQSHIAQRVADSARAWNTDFIVGTGFIKTYPKNTHEVFRGYYGKKPYNVFNATMYVNAQGQRSIYEKANLVPIVERIPFLNTLTALDVFDWVDWGKLSGFGKGTTFDMLATSDFKTPGLICYDSVYPSWIRGFVQRNATFLTIITNDGWWGDTSGHRQHFAYARLRAIEFRRWIARSANNGISGIIAPNGSVKHETNFWERTGFTARIQNNTQQTFYTRFGDWLPQLCLVFVAVGWMFFLIQKKLKKS